MRGLVRAPQLLHQRLVPTDPAEALSPWIDRSNALMARLQQAVGQPKAFHADVAHALRAPQAS